MASLALPIIGGAGSLISGLIAGSAAKRAGKTLSDAGNAANKNIQDVTQTGAGFVSGATTGAQADVTNAEQQSLATRADVYNQQKQALNPYLAAGAQGVSSLSTALAPGGSLATQFALPTEADVEKTPGYQFQLNQGNQALARSAAAGGNLMSGGTAKALDQYSQGLASTYYQNAVNNALTAYQTNHNNTLGGLMALSSFGLPATGQFNTAAQNYGNTSAADIMNAGQYVGNTGLQGSEFNANYTLGGTNTGLGYYMQGQQGLAAAQMGQGNAWQNAVNGFSGAAGYGFGSGGGFGGGMVSDIPGGYSGGGANVWPTINSGYPSAQSPYVPNQYISPYSPGMNGGGYMGYGR